MTSKYDRDTPSYRIRKPWYDHIPSGLLFLVFLYVAFCSCVIILAPDCVEDRSLGIDKTKVLTITSTSTLDPDTNSNSTTGNNNGNSNGNSTDAGSSSPQCFKGYIDDSTISWSSGFFVTFVCLVLVAHLCWYRCTSRIKYRRAVRPSAILGTLCLGIAMAVQSCTKLWFGTSTTFSPRQQQQHPLQEHDDEFYSTYSISFIFWMMAVVFYRKFAVDAYTVESVVYRHAQENRMVPTSSDVEDGEHRDGTDEGEFKADFDTNDDDDDDNDDDDDSSTQSDGGCDSPISCHVTITILEMLLLIATLTMVGASTACSLLDADDDEVAIGTSNNGTSTGAEDFPIILSTSASDATVCERIVFYGEFFFYFLYALFLFCCCAHFLSRAVQKKQPSVFSGYQFYYLGLSIEHAAALIPWVQCTLGCILVWYSIATIIFPNLRYHHIMEDYYGVLIFHASMLITVYCMHNIARALTVPQVKIVRRNSTDADDNDDADPSDDDNANKSRCSFGGRQKKNDDKKTKQIQSSSRKQLLRDTSSNEEEHDGARWTEAIDDLTFGVMNNNHNKPTGGSSIASTSANTSVVHSSPARSVRSAHSNNVNTTQRDFPLDENEVMFGQQEERRRKRWEQHQRRRRERMERERIEANGGEGNSILSQYQPDSAKIVRITPVEEKTEIYAL